MKREERQQRLALTLLVTGIVLAVTLATLLLVGCAIALLVHFGVLTGPNQSSPSAVRIIIVFAASSFAVSAVMTFFASKIPLKPVNKIINHINRLASGDYKARMEVGELWEKHPSMSELTNSLNRLSEELESTEMLRSDFINNFSHEFKTPIVSITGFAKLIKRGNLSEEQREEYLEIIEEESMRLSKMATNVLNLTKVENQTILTEVTTFNLSEQLRDSVLLLSEKWEKKDLEFLIDFGEHDIEANEELLKQVWINLLDNAIKFSPEGGTIKLQILESAQMLSVSITNSGGEISPEHQKRIFNKFYQVDESHAAEGNGIGLAIVKRVTELHNGTVFVQSEDGTTTFTVELPKENF